MPRILGLDYGQKRTGIAVTDPLQIIASGLTTVPTGELWDWLTDYLKTEEVERIVIGEPTHIDGTPTHVATHITGLIRKLKKTFPHLDVLLRDEAYSSATARQWIIDSGAKQKKRRQKALVDQMAALVILREYMEREVW